MKKVVKEKKTLFEEWLPRQNGMLWERYREKRKGCKQVVTVPKRWRWGRKLTKNMFMRGQLYPQHYMWQKRGA